MYERVAVTFDGAVITGDSDWETTAMVVVLVANESPAWFVSFTERWIVPTGPALNRIEFVRPSAESSPALPPTLSMKPESSVHW